MSKANRMREDEAPVVAVISEEATPIPKALNKMVSMEDPFKAFQVISTHADLGYITKLGKVLTGVSEIMREEEL